MQSGVDPNHLRVPLHSPIADAYTFHPPPHPHGHPHPVVGRPRTPPRTPPRRSSRTPPPHTVSRPFDYAIAADGSIITVPLQAHQHTPITIGAYPSPLPVPLPAPLPPPPVELTPMQRLFEDGGLPVEFTQPPHPPTTTTDDTKELSRSMKFLGIASAFLAIVICVGGSVILSENDRALTSYQQCDQLYVWGMLFVIFEGLYFIFMFVHGCFSDESFHTKRFKSLIMLVLFFMSVLFFIWGTIIINTSSCPEADYEALWLYFRVLYWFIIGVWSVVLIMLIVPVILFFVLKTYMKK